MTVPDNPGYQDKAAEVVAGREPCWTLKAKFCARRANGRPRCKKGSCMLLEDAP